MNHVEIRAIRGMLSRAAFARLLGVTPLTVLRWELPEDNKEARRPRAKMIELLRRLAAEGVGATGTVLEAATGPEDDEEEDAEASEPVGETELGRSRATGSELSGDELLLLPLLEALDGANWRRAEDELLSYLQSGALSGKMGRSLATLGLVQVQILARMDVRGALAVLLPILEDAEAGRLPDRVAARAHVIATMVFAAPDSRTFDVGRVNAHAARAEALLDSEADDLRVIAATSCVAAARFLGADVTLHTYQNFASSWSRARSPLACMMADGIAGLVATIRNDFSSGMRLGGQALAAAEACGHWGLVGGILSDYAGQTLRGSLSPEATLAVAERGRRSAQEAALAPTEGFIRLLGSEVEALCRLARFEDALASANEGLALARRSGLASYALTAPVSRLYLFTGRLAELKDLADSFETDGGGMQRAAARAHAGYVRALLASLAGDFAGAARLCEEIVLSPENTPGLDYLLHAAHFEATVSFAMAQEPDLAAAALARAQAHLERAPSVWHATMLRRAEAIILMQRGELNQARQRIEATQATFTLLGDKVQAALEVGGLSMIALISGAPDAADQMARALADIEALGVDTKFLERRARVITTPAAPTWREQTMAEKLVVAVDRLSVKGLDEAAFRRELTAVLTKLFPGREPVVGGAELERDGAFVKTGDGDGALYFGLRGSVDAEQRAALSLLASFLRQHAPSAPAFAEADLQLEGLLPAFIAASPSTRQLKSEIVRLSRSNATILIRGESGAGKEVVARAVHDASQRADKPYVTLNCASVPRELFESQLFGYRKGSFTGAVNDSAGVIRAADGGTLFLDEIGELPLEMQPKLLRFLENGEVQPLGEQRPRRVDVRVIAATHRDLSRLVHEQRFREDLYYRLNVIPLTVPPLRERKEDVIALARLFIGRAVPADTPPPQLAVDAVRALEAYTWPGNVRELRNVVDRALAFAPIPSVLSAEHLRISLA